jgi:hypothetical protein
LDHGPQEQPPWPNQGVRRPLRRSRVHGLQARAQPEWTLGFQCRHRAALRDSERD